MALASHPAGTRTAHTDPDGSVCVARSSFAKCDTFRILAATYFFDGMAPLKCKEERMSVVLYPVLRPRQFLTGLLFQATQSAVLTAPTTHRQILLRQLTSEPALFPMRQTVGYFCQARLVCV